MAGNVAEQKKLILPFLQVGPCLLLFLLLAAQALHLTSMLNQP